AFCRGYHAMNDEPKIFDDTLGLRLLSEEERAGIQQGLVTAVQMVNPELAAASPDPADALAWMVQSFMPSSLFISRARYTEDILAQAVRQGVRQYVILGAGMDTFAFRRPEMLEQLQVFEVDHPATQASKRQRLAELGQGIPAQLHFVPVDFTRDDLAAALKESGYDSRIPTFFSWLGVVHYLPRDAVFDTLRKLTGISPAGSSVIFDYYDNDAFNPERAAQRVKAGMEIARRAGEPQVTGFDSSVLAAELQEVGLHLQEHLSPADIQERYFQGRSDGYYAYEHAHFAWAVVKPD
ncbi:class I SAM-dependent methyltransferase, partial [bacterium]